MFLAYQPMHLGGVVLAKRLGQLAFARAEVYEESGRDT
jgi:hypothetical protein